MTMKYHGVWLAVITAQLYIESRMCWSITVTHPKSSGVFQEKQCRVAYTIFHSQKKLVCGLYSLWIVFHVVCMESNRHYN